MTAFCIDFAIEGKIVPIENLEVLEYDSDALIEELQAYGATQPEQLTDWDRCVFNTEEEANAFLGKYIEIYRLLANNSFCLGRHLKALPYRKRNIVQSLMGAKMQTHRKFYRNFEPGQLINLHDRKNFLTVKILSVTKDEEGFKYAFELPQEIKKQLAVELGQQ